MPSTINELSVIKLGNKGHALEDLFHHGSICLRLSLSLIGLQRSHNFYLHHCLFLTGHEPAVSAYESFAFHLSLKSSPITVPGFWIFVDLLCMCLDINGCILPQMGQGVAIRYFFLAPLVVR